MSIPILDQAADNLLAKAALAGRIDVALLAALDRDARTAWAKRIAQQVFTGALDYSPPSDVYAPPEIDVLDERLGDQAEREARRTINRYRADRAAGRVAHLGGIDRALLARLAPDLVVSDVDLWGAERPRTGSRIGEEPR